MQSARLSQFGLYSGLLSGAGNAYSTYKGLHTSCWRGGNYGKGSRVYNQNTEGLSRQNQTKPTPLLPPNKLLMLAAAMQREFDDKMSAELTQKQTVNYQKSVIENIGIEGKNAVQQQRC